MITGGYSLKSAVIHIPDIYHFDVLPYDKSSVAQIPAFAQAHIPTNIFLGCIIHFLSMHSSLYANIQFCVMIMIFMQRYDLHVPKIQINYNYSTYPACRLIGVYTSSIIMFVLLIRTVCGFSCSRLFNKKLKNVSC